MKIFTIANQKGGTGKTATAAAIANAAIYRGLQVLAIDADPQANLSFLLAADTTGATCFDLYDGAAAADVIQTTRPGLDVIPASWNLSTVSAGPGVGLTIQRAIEPTQSRYDVVVIDTPPAPGILQYSGLQAATDLIIPLAADIHCLQSMYQTISTAQQIQYAKPELTIAGILFTQYDGRSSIVKHMKATIEGKAESAGIPCLGVIRKAVAVQEAAALQKSLFEYAPKSKPAADYLALFDRISTGGQ